MSWVHLCVGRCRGDACGDAWEMHGEMQGRCMGRCSGDAWGDAAEMHGEMQWMCVTVRVLRVLRVSSD